MPSTAKGPGKSKTPSRTTAPAQPRVTGEGSRDAIGLLTADHRLVEKYFDEFAGARGDADKRRLVNAICVALKVHARLEEDIFYPAAFAALKDAALIEEARVEHACARDLIAQIESGAPGEALFDARVTVLQEYVAHHVAEEEGEMFARCRESGLDLVDLGQRLQLRKNALEAGFKVANPVLALARLDT